MSMETKNTAHEGRGRGGPNVLRAAFLVTLALVLVGLVTRHSLVAYLTDVAPRSALALDPQNPVALVNIADGEVGRGFAKQAEETRLEALAKSAAASGVTAGAENADGSGDIQQDDPLGRDAWARVRENASTALQRDPFNARALRLIGQAAAAEHDNANAAKFMAAAAKLSKRERIAYAWLLEQAVRQKDFGNALDYADILLRVHPQLMAPIAPLLGQIAEASGKENLLVDYLRASPPWRSSFLSYLPRSIRDARTPLKVLLQLRDTQEPPTARDLRPYIDLLIKNKFIELAYYTWLQFLPPDQLSKAGFLFNGSFETEPAGLPFDWTYTSASGVTIERAPKPGLTDQRALYIEFGQGRVDFKPVTQITMLGPNRYRMTGVYRGELIGPRGLRWRIECLGGSPIAEGDLVTGIAKDWSSFSIEFTVPQDNCRAQRLSLILDARMASERFVSGFIWYDELTIATVKTDTVPK